MKKTISILFGAVVLMALTAAQTSKGKVLKLDFSNPVQEQASSSPFDIMSMIQGSGQPMSLLSYVRAIETAAADPSISMIYMTPDKISAGMAQVEEIRGALERFRESGKPVIAYCENLSAQSYYLATAASKVILNPSSDPFLTGVATQQFFLKDILDTLGIDVQLIRHGKYKSAGEMFVRNSSSEENAYQNREMVKSLWNSMATQIATARGITVNDLNAWIDGLELAGAQSFKSLGLVDELWYKDQVDSCILSMTGMPDMTFVRFVKEQRYADKLPKGNRGNQIAVVYADGEIVDESSTGQDIVGSSLARTLSKVAAMPKVKAVVFRVNSPGGSSQAAELIRREVERLSLEKPVYVSFGDYAASGGYWISAGGQKIFTDNTTLTGSIGVFSIVPSFGKALHKNLKVNMEVIGSNAHSDMIAGMRPLQDDELAFFQSQVERVYDQFTGIVASGRNLPKDSVDAIGQGRVWPGAMALEIGLADTRGGLADAIRYAALEQGLTDGTYRIVEYPEVKEQSLLELLSGQVDDPEETLTTRADVHSILEGMAPSVPFVRSLTEPTIMTRMESIVRIR